MKMADLIRILFDAGAPKEAIIAAIEKYDEELEVKRERARIASKEYRDRKRHITSYDVTSRTPSPQVSLSPYNPLSLPNPPSPSEPNGSVSETSSDASGAAKKTRKRNVYPEAFERLWKAYPTDQNMSKVEGFGAWKRLSEEDRELCEQSIPSFRAFCEKNTDYRPIHLNRYISKRRFEGHAEKGKEIVERRAIKSSDPEWNVWKAYYRDTGQNSKATLMDSFAQQGRMFTVPSQYPPNYKSAAA